MLERRNTCPACGAGISDTLLEISYTNQDVFRFLCSYYRHAPPAVLRERLGDGMLSIVECSSCTLIYQREIPDPDFMHELYADWIIDSDDLSPYSPLPLAAEQYAYLASEVMHLLAEQRRVIGAGRRIRVLDFGMGWGTWLQMARSLGASVFGAELSAPKIDYARSVGIPVLTLDEIASMRFDVVCTEQVLEHVPHPAELLRSLSAALAPTGFLKISVPPGGNIRATLAHWDWRDAFARRQQIMPVHPLEHINCFTARSLDRLAAHHGLLRASVSALRAMAQSTGWNAPRPALKNLLRPIYRFALARGTYRLYRLAARSA